MITVKLFSCLDCHACGSLSEIEEARKKSRTIRIKSAEIDNITNEQLKYGALELLPWLGISLKLFGVKKIFQVSGEKELLPSFLRKETSPTATTTEESHRVPLCRNCFRLLC